MLAIAAPEQRCRALLLFYNLLLAVVLPLLLLVPLRQHYRGDASPSQSVSTDSSGTSRRGHGTQDRWGIAGRMERRIEGWLRLLMWPPAEWASAHRAAADGRPPQQQQADAPPPQSVQAAAATWLLHWWVVLASVWSLCCILHG